MAPTANSTSASKSASKSDSKSADAPSRSSTAPQAAPLHEKRVFSGIQPTGDLHLGNYLGALKPFAALQEDYNCVYCIVDLHAVTVWQDPAKLAAQTRSAAAQFLAAGIDPSRAILFNQSQVTAHSELGWLFACIARMGWMERMTQFKDKAGKNSQHASAALFLYPVLQAADILAYRATHVPVGEDQRQHLELTRDIAAKFNHDFGVEFFALVEPIIQETAKRVMSLRDGTQKMSKSSPSDMSRINLTDSNDAIAKKIRKAKTDTAPLPGSEALQEGQWISADQLAERPEAFALLEMMSALTGTALDALLADWGGRGFVDFKAALTEALVAEIAPLRSEILKFNADPAMLDQLLAEGAVKAEAIARPVLERVYDIFGFLRPAQHRLLS